MQALGASTFLKLEAHLSFLLHLFLQSTVSSYVCITSCICQSCMPIIPSQKSFKYPFLKKKKEPCVKTMHLKIVILALATFTALRRYGNGEHVHISVSLGSSISWPTESAMKLVVIVLKKRGRRWQYYRNVEKTRQSKENEWGIENKSKVLWMG